MKTSGGKKPTSQRKRPKVLLIILIILLLAVAGFCVWLWLNRANDGYQGGIFGIGQGENEEPAPIYSNFTGLEIADATENTLPTFCVQIPNGSTDGARPQAGLTHAGVVFEAIAETGITRFAAIFQNPQTGVIGPIRSLRPYYLDWDTPFDCTVVHDGGSQEALAAIASGGQRNLDENFKYMWKENNSSRLWNNVFTSPTRLMSFNQDHNYLTSNPQTFPRLTPNEVDEILHPFDPCSSLDPEDCDADQETAPSAHSIDISFTGLTDYNVHFAYDIESNTYLRSYQYGGAHMVYDCGVDSGATYTGDCPKVQVAPSAVVVMRVQENTMADGYHENIQTIGTGKAIIFQNGHVTETTWHKANQHSQIVFGDEIKFTPGQIWISAVPQFGSVSY